MMNYEKTWQKYAEERFKEYDEAHELLLDWLDRQNAPTIIKEAFKKCSRPPVITHC